MPINMTHENFCYWLQGLLEVGSPKTLDENQVRIIKEHLQLTFNPVTSTAKLAQYAEPLKQYLIPQLSIATTGVPLPDPYKNTFKAEKYDGPVIGNISDMFWDQEHNVWVKKIYGNEPLQPPVWCNNTKGSC